MYLVVLEGIETDLKMLMVLIELVYQMVPSVDSRYEYDVSHYA